MKPLRKALIIALVFWAAAAVLRFWGAPLLELLPANYANETRYTQENQFRDSPDGDWEFSQLVVWRTDHALVVKDGVLLIDGALHIYFESGALNFETSGLYAVERNTRQNFPGLGDDQRDGQYFFPSPVAQTSYTLWDPFYIGPQSVSFDHTETLGGLRVYVFTFAVKDLNETDGYSYLMNVPEQYLAHSNAKGTIWVEPLSGIVVDYADQGVSSFIDPASQELIADFNTWNNTYTPETRAAQLALARDTRQRILLLEAWLPGMLLLAGLIWLLVGWTKKSQ